jgi:hypothetical protein
MGTTQAYCLTGRSSPDRRETRVWQPANDLPRLTGLVCALGHGPFTQQRDGDFGGWLQVTQSAVWPLGVGVAPSLLDDVLGLFEL